MFGHMGVRSWHLEAFPKCLVKKPSLPLARAELRDFPEGEFSVSLREVPLVWDVHQKIPNEIQCAPSDEIKLAGQVCPPNLGRAAVSPTRTKQNSQGNSRFHKQKCLKGIDTFRMSQDALDDLRVVDERHGAHLVLTLGMS